MEIIDKKSIFIPAIVILAAYIIVIAGVMNAVSIINPILLGLFISIISIQPIKWLQSKKVSKLLAIFLVLFAVFMVFLGFSELIGSSLSSFSQNADLYGENLNNMILSVLEYFKTKGFNVSVSKLSGLFEVSKVMGVTAGFLKQFGSFMGNAMTIFFLTVFLLLELDSLSLKMKVAFKGSEESYSYISTILNSIRHYLTIKTMTSSLTGLLIWIMLSIIGVDYAIIWALIAFLLNYIPNFGSILAAFPAILFSAVQLGFTGVIWTTISFAVVNIVIGNVIEPKIMGKGLGLSTYVVFISLLFWGFVLGTIGMFLSIPLTMAIKIMLEQSPKTKKIALFLGSEEEIKAIAEKENVQ